MIIAVPYKNWQIDQSLTAGDVSLPSGVTLLTDPETIVVHCVKPMDQEAVPSEAGAAEPELIGRKPAEEGEESAE